MWVYEVEDNSLTRKFLRIYVHKINGVVDVFSNAHVLRNE